MIDSRLALLTSEPVRQTGRSISDGIDFLVDQSRYKDQQEKENRLLELGQNQRAQDQVVTERKLALAEDQNKRSNQAFEQELRQGVGAEIYRSLEALKGIPASERLPHIENLAGQLSRFGFDDDDRAILSNERGLDQAIQVFSQFNPNGDSAATKNFNFMADGLSPEDVQKAKRIELGLDPRAQGASAKTVNIGNVPHIFDPTTGTMVPVKVDGKDVTTETVSASESEIEEGKASGKQKGKDIESRRSERINVGADAAKGIPTLKRALTLLERVETGGPEAISLAVRQRLGVEGADEGELSNKLGKSVLAQLRSTFGAQFTEKEGERLDRIEARFGRNTETNKRLLNELLQVAEKNAKQAMKDASEIEDFETAQAIKDSMNFQFDENDEFLPNQESARETFTSSSGIQFTVE